MKKVFFTILACSISLVSFAQWNNIGDCKTTGNLQIGSGTSSYPYFQVLAGAAPWTIADITFDFNAGDRATIRAEKGEGSNTYLHFQTRDGSKLDEIVMTINNGGLFIYKSLVVKGTTWVDDIRAAKSMVIGCPSSFSPTHALEVNGTIRAKEVRVETGWADFVFQKDYKLPTLQEVKAHIDEHKHLPGMPSEAEVKENGVGLADATTRLLQKVEELTLYAIQQNEKIEALSNEIKELKDEKK